MFSAHEEFIVECILEEGLLAKAELNQLEKRTPTGGSLVEAVIDSGKAGKESVLRAVARGLGFALCRSVPKSIPENVRSIVPSKLALQFAVVPWRETNGVVDILCCDPFDGRLSSQLGFALDRRVRLHVADPEEVAALLRVNYGDQGHGWDALLEELRLANKVMDPESASAEELKTMAAETPVVRLVEFVLDHALNVGASDIHFEPFEDGFRIRCRADGTLREVFHPPASCAVAVISRIKVMADLNISERRLPQDGSIRRRGEGEYADFRVSTLPVQHGESVVLRVLDRSRGKLELAGLRMPEPVLTGIRDVIRRPHGIFIVTGPTGSGKSTTLYSALSEINETQHKILTIEDPVEYEIDGIVQVAVRPEQHLTFARALRAFLRHDPDVLMVGEIRDTETARIAMQAAMTGHLVFATLHTGDSPGAVVRLMDMGIEPYLVAASLEAVLSQRLLRRLCPRCRRPVPVDVAARRFAETGAVEKPPGRLYEASGCPECRHTGYNGRIGVFEFMLMSERIRRSVFDVSPLSAVREAALSEGMQTLQMAALDLLSRGETSFEEVIASVPRNHALV